MNVNFWIQKWSTDQTPWDIGQGHPLIPGLLNPIQNLLGDLSSCRALVPGCGSGHDTLKLKEAGFGDVLGVDVAPGAIERATKLYGEHRSIQFLCMNFLEQSKFEGTFDLLFDHAMLCALPEALRVQYISQCARALRPNGAFVSICFEEVDDSVQGPPFAISLAQMRALLGSDFEEYEVRQFPAQARSPVIKKESTLIFTKKSP